jgi:cyclohexanecarboxylate-CoA ligase
MNLWALVQKRASETPSRLMLVDERGRRTTFREFRDRAERVASWLVFRGVEPGSPVTWQLPTTIEALVLTAALARVGAVQNPVMPVYGARDLRFIVRQTGAQALVVAPGRKGAAEWARELAEASAGLDLLILDGPLPELHQEQQPLPAEPRMVDQPVRWIFYTSGTTSEPKGAQHTDDSVLTSSKAMGERLGCTTEDRVGMAFPVAHVGGCGTWLGTCLMFGCTLLLDSAFDADRSEGFFRNEGVTIAGSGTVFIQMHLDSQRRRPSEPLFPALRAMTAGAAPKPPSLHMDVKKELGGVGVLSGYGLTKAPVLAMSSPDDPDSVLAVTEGRAAGGAELRVVGPDGTELKPGGEGEIRAKGRQVMKGYLDASLNAAAFDEFAYLRTGDLGRIDGDGNVTITGRLKDVILRKGETISARAVEEQLLQHSRIAEVAVIGLPDAERGEMACAVVVPAGDGPRPWVEDMASFLDERGLPPWQWPERVEIVAKLPRNPTGKILKNQLRRRYS